MNAQRDGEPTPPASESERALCRLELATREHPIALGRYDVVGRLGRGGMGAVYEAIDRSRNAKVAIKTLLSSAAEAPVQIKREFRAVADMAHPNLAPVYELALEDGLWFFAMEHIEGVDLSRWARGVVDGPDTLLEGATATRAVRMEGTTRHEGAPVFDDDSVRRIEEREATSIPVSPASLPTRPIAQICEAFLAIASGLSALHDAGLCHGDVKPGNVVVRSDHRAVLVDFGLARSVADKTRTHGPTSGTPGYMSPEQFIGGEVGPASDWYAVGTMLYEVLTGLLPYGATAKASAVELYLRKTLHTPPSPRELLPEIPAVLSDLCMSLLHADATLRPARRELVAALAGHGAPALALREPRARSVFIGRDRELGLLQSAYERARSGRCTVAHVQGPSGIGKSAIVRTFLGGVRDVEGAEVLRGRCYERETVPYKAFDGIVDELTLRLKGMGDEAVSILPAWIGELAQAFPVLEAIPAVAARVASLPAMEAVEAKERRRRAWSALRQLLEVIGRERTVVLWIDDLHWADADSAGLLESLVRDAARAPLLVVASYRSIEAANNDALTSYFELAHAGEGARVEVPLGPLSATESEQLARATLDGLPSDVAMGARAKELADEAAGVPLFIEELARFVASRGETDLDAKASLDDAIAARIRALPHEQRALVEVVAVADNPIAQSLVFEAAGLDSGSLPSLLALRSASMLSWTGAGATDLVYPYHDRIRESVVASLDEAAKRAHHLALGRAIAARHALDPRAASVFDAVRHLGAAKASLTDASERAATARLFLEAGRAARTAAAFPLAFRCFDEGIALLDARAWTDAYDLALALHIGAVETAYLSAEWAALDARFAEVKAHARCTMDQLAAWEVQIDALAGRHEYGRAIDTGMEVLELLSVRLPRDPSDDEVGAAFQRALADLTRVGPAGLESMPDVADPVVRAAMRLQIRLSPSAYFSRPKLLPIIASNLVTTSVERGLSTATPYALALIGIVMNTAGMYPVSHEWGQLAVRLLDRWEDRSLEAATRHVVFNLVCPWMVPLHTILAPLREVFDIGRRTGDLEYASYAAHGYTHNAMYAARPLLALAVEARELGDQMRALGQVNALHVHMPFEQLLKCWTGAMPDPSRLDDATFDESALLAAASSQGSRSGTFVIRVAMGLARYHFGRAEEASECFEIARAHLDAAPSVWHVPILHQFAVLSACAAWDSLGDDARRGLRAKLDRSVEALRVLAGHAPVNFAHRVSLADGELRRIDGDVRGAFARFVEAAEQAREGGWTNDIALARELAARCQQGAAARRASLEAARDAYAAWGATAKVAQLEAQLGALGG